jgi:GMP synthase-like glutamine amidotransferase
MKPVLIVTHLEDRSTGLVRACLEAAGWEVLQVDKVDAEPLPAVSSVSGIVSMGGRESATRADEDAFLSAEVELMAQALAIEVPLLGLCLGAQLLAVAGGGRVRAIGRMVADWEPIAMCPTATADPVFDALPDGLAVLKWHEDMIEAPPGATSLATAPGPGAALFRVGACAWGSQAHLEVTPRLLVDTWLADPGSTAEIEGAGHPIDEFRALSRRALERQMPAGRAVFSRFAATLSGQTEGGRPSDSRRR